MNNKTPHILLSLIFLALALYLVPVAAAQESNMLTDTANNIGNTLGAIPGQVSDFVTANPIPTAAIITPTTIAGGLGIAYKSVSSAKNKLQSSVNSLSGQLSSAEQKAQAATEQLTTQTSALQAQASSATEQLTQYKADSQIKINDLSGKLETVTQQKASFQNLNEDLTAKLKTAQDQLKVLIPQVR